MRPGGLKSDAATGNAILTADMMASGTLRTSCISSIKPQHANICH